jgi:hypothetical protein
MFTGEEDGISININTAEVVEIGDVVKKVLSAEF